jgi:diguanylate cyclase (GGDEF)-like protein
MPKDIIRTEIDRIFEDFQNYLQEKEEFQIFIKKIPDVNILLNFYKTILMEFLKEGSEFEELFFDIGLSLKKIHFPFPLFVEGISFFEQKFIETFLNKTFTEEIFNIFESFEKIKDYVAKGYLKYDILETKSELISKQIPTTFPSSLISNIKFHHEWFEKFLDVLLEEKDLKSELCNDICKFEPIIEDKLKDSFPPEKYEEFKKIHLEMHQLAFLLVYLYESKEFEEAYFVFQDIKNHSLEMENLLSFFDVLEFAKEIKYDSLTGMLSRRLIPTIMKKELELAYLLHKPFILAMVDIDDFKQINDNYGHLIGDCVLKGFSEFLRDKLRKSDYIFRYGGEEFLILMPTTDLVSAVKVLNKLRKQLEFQSFKCNGHQIKITVSIGVKEINENEMSKPIEDIINEVDNLMYTAKKAGKNRVIF